MYLQDYKTYLDLELYSDVGSNADSKEHGCCFNLEPFIAAFGGYRDTACHHRKKISAVLFNVFINCLNEEIKYTVSFLILSSEELWTPSKVGTFMGRCRCARELGSHQPYEIFNKSYCQILSLGWGSPG